MSALNIHAGHGIVHIAGHALSLDDAMRMSRDLDRAVDRATLQARAISLDRQRTEAIAELEARCPTSEGWEIIGHVSPWLALRIHRERNLVLGVRADSWGMSEIISPMSREMPIGTGLAVRMHDGRVAHEAGGHRCRHCGRWIDLLSPAPEALKVPRCKAWERA